VTLRGSFAIAGLAAAVVVAAIAAPACKKTGPAATATATAADVPKRWADLRLPTDRLKKVLARTDAHGYYADYEYAGADQGGLWEKVATALKAAGYAPACTAFGGNVRGFAKGDDKLAAKIDAFPGVLSLSIFDEQGKEPLLHGVCFGKYQLGPRETIK
jgi:hypothetical protein